MKRLITFIGLGILAFGKFTPASAQTDCVTPPSGIVGWWPAEGNANDIVSGNNGVLMNGAGYAAGEVGTAFNLNGVNQYVLVQATNSALNVGQGNGFTFEGWVYPTDLSINRPVVEYENHLGTSNGSDVGVQFYVSLGGYVGMIFANILDTGGNSHTITSAVGLMTTNAWQHVALTYDETTGLATLYRNGIVATQQNLGFFTPQTSFTNFLIGARTTFGSVTSPSDKFAGRIDELSVYQRALSASEVQSIYNAGSAGKCAPLSTCVPPPSGIVSWWPAEGNANDIVSGNNGVMEGGASFAPGEVGQAFSLDGTSGYVMVPDSSSLNVGVGGEFTVEGWIESPTITAQQIVVEWQNPGTLACGVHMMTGTDNGGGSSAGALFANIVDTSGNYHEIWSSPGVLVTNQFQHFALTYDSSGVGTLYVNGSVVAQSNLGVFTPQTSYNFYMGERLGEALNYSGLLDEISIYDRALSTNEIQAIYNAGSAGKCDGPFSPGIIEQPLGQTVSEGSNVSLSVVAAGSGSLNYQWAFNGTNIVGATNATLNLANIHSNLSGNYSVVISTTFGSITSSVVTVTVIAQDILVYKYSGTTKITTAGLSFTYTYSGQLFYIPAATNGTFVVWAVLNKEKEYATSSLTDYLVVTIPGPGKQIFTVLGLAGQEIDGNGYPHIWSYLHKGLNTSLAIANKRYFSFPNTFSSDETHIYPDSQTGNMILDESTSTYTFLPQNTQTANNTGQTMIDLVNSLTNLLVGQGYQQQQN